MKTKTKRQRKTGLQLSMGQRLKVGYAGGWLKEVLAAIEKPRPGTPAACQYGLLESAVQELELLWWGTEPVGPSSRHLNGEPRNTRNTRKARER